MHSRQKSLQYSIQSKKKLNNKLRAMKEIPKENIENVKDTKNIVFSINILANLKHPNSIQLYEFYEDDKNLKANASFQNLQLNIANIGLINLINNINKNIDENKILGIKELINAICDDINELLIKNNYENLIKQSRMFF